MDNSIGKHPCALMWWGQRSGENSFGIIWDENLKIVQPTEFIYDTSNWSYQEKNCH